MKIKTIAGLFALALIVFTSACKKGFKTTDDGLKYMYVVESDTGEVAGEEGFVRLHILMKTPTDSTLTDTYKDPQGAIAMTLPKPTYAGCIYSGFAMLKAGDSAIFKVRADSLYEKTFGSSLPEFLKGEDELTITVSVLESKSKATIEKEQKEDNEKKAKASQAQLAADTKVLEEAAAKMGVKEKLQYLPSGLMYYKMKETSGPTAQANDIGQFFYKGTLTDGTVFDSNIGKDAFPVTIGAGGVIPGWLEVVDKIKVGEKWMLFVPSGLAYGDRGAGEKIGPNTPLIFEMELTAIKTAEQLKKEEEERNKKLSAAEKQKIASAVGKNKKMQKLAVGEGFVYYVIEKEGTGNVAMPNDMVKVKLKGSDLDGKAIPQFVMEEPPYEGPLKKGVLPAAMEMVLMKMKKGSVARVITPSEFFHGSAGGGVTPPYTPIMIEMELVDISKMAPEGSMPEGAPQQKGGK